jgi:GDSL-like Lipase/Acylhydrolase family
MIQLAELSSRGWAGRFGGALIALLLLGLAGELLLRLYPGAAPAAQGLSEVLYQIETQSALGKVVYAPDPELGALMAPSRRDLVETLDFAYVLQTDHAGFPNPEPWPSQVDVAVLGDSLLIGPGVGMEGQFTTLLGRRLDGRSVMNLGLPGGGTEHQYLVYRRYVEPLHPRLVIAVIGVTWDIDNTLRFERWRTENPTTDFTLYRKSFGATHRPSWEVVKSQLARSHLVRAGYQGLKALFANGPLLEQVTFPSGDTIFLSAREQQSLARGMRRPGAPDLREIFFDPLERLRTGVQTHGGRFVVALLPGKEELYGAEAFPAVLRAAQEVTSELEARQLPVLDLYPAFRELGRRKSAFYCVDIHLNELGNQIVADELGRWIVDEKIFTSPSTAANAAGSGAD